MISTDDALQAEPAFRDTSAAIQADNVQHYYGAGELRKQVLYDNNLSIEPGQIIIMTGPSGSGKTTLLTLIGTLRRVQHGELWVLNRPLHAINDAGLLNLRREIGFIFQAHNLFDSLTATQNVRMALELASAAPFTNRANETLQSHARSCRPRTSYRSQT